MAMIFPTKREDELTSESELHSDDAMDRRRRTRNASNQVIRSFLLTVASCFLRECCVLLLLWCTFVSGAIRSRVVAASAERGGLAQPHLELQCEAPMDSQ